MTAYPHHATKTHNRDIVCPAEKACRLAVMATIFIITIIDVIISTTMTIIVIFIVIIIITIIIIYQVIFIVIGTSIISITILITATNLKD